MLVFFFLWTLGQVWNNHQLLWITNLHFYVLAIKWDAFIKNWSPNHLVGYIWLSMIRLTYTARWMNTFKRLCLYIYLCKITSTALMWMVYYHWCLKFASQSVAWLSTCQQTLLLSIFIVVILLSCMRVYFHCNKNWYTWCSIHIKYM